MSDPSDISAVQVAHFESVLGKSCLETKEEEEQGI